MLSHKVTCQVTPNTHFILSTEGHSIECDILQLRQVYEWAKQFLNQYDIPENDGGEEIEE